MGDQVESLAKALQTYGGWGVASLFALALIWVVRFHLKDTKERNKREREDERERAKQERERGDESLKLAIQLVKEVTQSQLETRASVDRHSAELTRHARKLKATKALIEAVHHEVTKCSED